MNRNDALKLLGAFLCGQHPFEKVKTLVGPASADIPAVFLTWFSGLADADQCTLAEVLIELVTESGELDKHLPKLCCLMVEIVADYPSTIPRAAIANVERLVRNRQLARIWLNDQETEEDDLKDFRTRWRYALTLWNFLWLVRSPTADEVFDVFAKSAQDPQFARSIRLAKSMPRRN